MSVLRTLLLIAGTFCMAGTSAAQLLTAEPATQQQNPDVKSLDQGLRIKYRFENKLFTIPNIELDIEPSGATLLKFTQTDVEGPLERKFTLMPKTLARCAQLLEKLRFLDSSESYQSKKDFSHLGWMTLSVKQGTKEREVKVNYSFNPDFTELLNILKGITTQEIDMFSLDLALHHQPLDTPKWLEILENDLKLERISEPDRLLVDLRELVNDNTLPLIARNQASKIAAGIEKGKFKTPLKPSK